ncbi:hypothetical protein [Allocoleopsis franciscana]|uniref:hypothetical protein n=1 Tax=Allocoleopsis franciscana TaxID=2886352 RepID=UPI0012DC71D8|nr:hypothetical protein [Allocoleopsis franciscana]
MPFCIMLFLPQAIAGQASPSHTGYRSTNTSLIWAASFPASALNLASEKSP